MPEVPRLPPVATAPSAFPPVGDVVTQPERAQVVANLRAYFDELDEQTRQPGEPTLREAVAMQARERLAEMDTRCEVALCCECGLIQCRPGEAVCVECDPSIEDAQASDWNRL